MSMEPTITPAPEGQAFVEQLGKFRGALDGRERSLLDAMLLAAAHDVETPLYLERLAELRRALPDARRPGLDALLVAASAPSAGDVQGYAMSGLMLKRSALAAVLALGLGASALGAPGGGTAQAAPLAHPSSNDNMPGGNMGGGRGPMGGSAPAASPNMGAGRGPTTAGAPSAGPNMGSGTTIQIGLGSGPMPGAGLGTGNMTGAGLSTGTMPGPALALPGGPGSSGLTIDPTTAVQAAAAGQAALAQLAQLQQQLAAAQQQSVPSYVGNPATDPSALRASSMTADAQAQAQQLQQQISDLSQQVRSLGALVDQAQQQQAAVPLAVSDPPLAPPAGQQAVTPPAAPPAAPAAAPSYLPIQSGTDPGTLHSNAQIASANGVIAAQRAHDALNAWDAARQSGASQADQDRLWSAYQAADSQRANWEAQRDGFIQQHTNQLGSGTDRAAPPPPANPQAADDADIHRAEQRGNPYQHVGQDVQDGIAQGLGGQPAVPGPRTVTHDTQGAMDQEIHDQDHPSGSPSPAAPSSANPLQNWTP